MDTDALLLPAPLIPTDEFVTPLTLTWNNISVDVPSSPSTTSLFSRLPCFSSPSPLKRILNSASGTLHPGELVAILGASGAGKTTLLSCLSGRLQPASGSTTTTTTTTTFPHGQGSSLPTSLAHGSSRHLIAFIQQEDLFLPNLTVGEHLKFQARLRLPHLPRAEAEGRAAELLVRLGLAASQDTLIGSGGEGLAGGGGGRGRGISGGERKRLSIASALISNPSLILADEPTSGLDSQNAAMVIETLRALASRGCSIIATIHSPSSQVFALFDRVLLLAAAPAAVGEGGDGGGGGGRVVYDGTAQAALARFGEAGAVCPPLTNPADFFIHTLSPLPHSHPSAPTHNALLHSLLKALTKDAPEAPEAAAAAITAAAAAASADTSTPSPTGHLSRSSWCHQFRVLLHRNSLSMSRDPVLLYTRWAQTLVVAGLAGAVYWQLGRGQSSVMDKSGAGFFLLINQSLASIVGVLQTFPLERAVVGREHAGGVHCVSAYFTAKSLSAAPWEVAFPAVFSTLCYFSMGLRPAGEVWSWGAIVATVVLTAQVATSMGLWVSSVSPSVAVALALAPVVLLPFVLFSGFLLSISSIPSVFLPLQATSLYRYAFSAVMLTLWGGQGQGGDLVCDKGPFACPFPTGDAVLRYFGLEGDSFTRDLMALGALALGWRLLAMVTLMWQQGRRL